MINIEFKILLSINYILYVMEAIKNYIQKQKLLKIIL